MEANDGGDQTQCMIMMAAAGVCTSFLISEHTSALSPAHFSTNSSPIHKVWGSFSSPDLGE
jgi:ABC-type uncharacterized transport system ATPase component